MSETEVLKLLESAILAAREGDREQAYIALRQVIDADPDNVAAWLWLAGVTDSPREGKVALNRVQQLDPDNPRLEEARAWLQAQNKEAAAADSEVEPGRLDLDDDDLDLADPESEPAGLDDDDAGFAALKPEEQGEEPPTLTEDAENAETAPEEETEGLKVEPAALETPLPETTESPDETSDFNVQDASLDELVETGPIRRLADAEDSTPQQAGSVRRRRVLALLAAVLVLLLLLIIGLAKCGGIAGAQAGPPPTPTQTDVQRLEALQPRFKQAVAESEWEDALAVLQIMRVLAPDETSMDRDAAFVNYKLAVNQRQAGDWDAAQKSLAQALTYAPDNQQALLEQERLEQMLKGQQLYDAGKWEQAIAVLAPLYQEDAGYSSVADLLCDAYCSQGEVLQTADDLQGAQEAYEAAAAVFPNGSLAREKAREITLLLTPPTPTITPTATASPTATPTPAPSQTPTPTLVPTPDPARQRIEIDISDQRMYVYQDDQLVWDWVCSTGEPGKDTATGTYAVESKIGTAYASTWNLDMPFWLGIYQSGPLENGIHALPIQRANGIKLWEGYLGQRVSYGCIILSDENAQTLYNWAQIGTPVIIRW